MERRIVDYLPPQAGCQASPTVSVEGRQTKTTRIYGENREELERKEKEEIKSRRGDGFEKHTTPPITFPATFTTFPQVPCSYLGNEIPD